MNEHRDTILHLLKTSHIISGEEIAQILSISRTAVWKQIQILKKKGYQIESMRHKGYQLLSSPNAPIEEEIKTSLYQSRIVSQVYHFHSLDSTNTYTKQLMKQNDGEGIIVVSDIQTNGRGRKQRRWISDEGGLWFSILLQPQIPIEDAMIVTMAVSLAVKFAIVDTTGLIPMIKWPNDLLIDGKKTCGILTEIDAELDRINSIIIGIGINVNNSLDSNIKNKTTSLKQESNKTISLIQLLKSILTHLDRLYEQIIRREFNSIQKQWIKHTDTIGKTIRVHDQNEYVEGFAYGITEKGHLLLKTATGNNRILSGDIEYIT